MAPRLSIVISQAPSHDASVADLEQGLVTALMFEPGMDPMLIGHLEGIEAGTTDHLCLEGIRGDFVILGWLSAQNAYDQLARLGIFARPGALPSTLRNGAANENAVYPEPTAGTITSSQSLPAAEQLKRRLYLVDLRGPGFRDPHKVLLGLKELLQDRQTKAVPIRLGGKPLQDATGLPQLQQSPVMPVIYNPNPAPATQLPAKSIEPRPVTSSRDSDAIPTRAEAHTSVTPLAQDDEDNPQWQQLDKLLDDFDSLEI